MPKAVLVFHRKRRFDDGTISEMRLLPGPVRGSRHLFRYSLFSGRGGQRLIAYDNDHEESYEFTTPERLVANFLADVRAAQWARQH